MASSSEDYTVTHAENIDTVDTLWWGMMQELGWDRSHNDLPLHWHVTPHWPTVAPRSTPTQPVGLCTPFIYDNRTGWLGFFILRPQHRGKGWGGAVFAAGLEAFKAAGLEYVGLDAVQEQKGTYERRGFREVSRIRVMERRLGVGVGEEVGVGEGMEVCDARGFEQGRLVEYEEAVTGFRRSKLWSDQGMWRREAKDVAGFVVVKSTTKGKEVVGLAVIKDCQHGYRLGPVYAESKSVATVLLDKALRWAGHMGEETDTVGIEANLGHPLAIKLFEDFGWRDLNCDYSRMWIDGKATPQQMPNGRFFTDCYAEYDAGQG